MVKNATGSNEFMTNTSARGDGSTSFRPPPPLPSREQRSDHHGGHTNRQQNGQDCRGGVGDEAATRAVFTGRDLPQDPAFDMPPPRTPPAAARALRRAFTFLRNACAGCPGNNHALRHTGLAESASVFYRTRLTSIAFPAVMGIIVDTLFAVGYGATYVRSGGAVNGGDIVVRVRLFRFYC